mmetsp:Transcript_139305/g.347271  ORF Transcript_139305/g.347271 Transcript_139305/m.347271 type:complete len:278 (-) Transcript_139305:162-995(-)
MPSVVREAFAASYVARSVAGAAATEHEAPLPTRAESVPQTAGGATVAFPASKLGIARTGAGQVPTHSTTLLSWSAKQGQTPSPVASAVIVHVCTVTQATSGKTAFTAFDAVEHSAGAGFQELTQSAKSRTGAESRCGLITASSSLLSSPKCPRPLSIELGSRCGDSSSIPTPAVELSPQGAREDRPLPKPLPLSGASPKIHLPPSLSTKPMPSPKCKPLPPPPPPPPRKRRETLPGRAVGCHLHSAPGESQDTEQRVANKPRKSQCSVQGAIVADVP